MILDIEMYGGHPPGWFDAQSHDAQVDLLAWYRRKFGPKPKKKLGPRAALDFWGS